MSKVWITPAKAKEMIEKDQTDIIYHKEAGSMDAFQFQAYLNNDANKIEIAENGKTFYIEGGKL